MGKVRSLLIIMGAILLAGFYIEWKYQGVSLFLEGSMDGGEQEIYIQDLHDGMLSRQETITLPYRGDSEELKGFVTESIAKAFKVDDKNTSSDYDYMRYVHKASHINMTGWGGIYQVTYEMEYLESLEQTEQGERRVKKILKKIITKDMSRYEKIKAIHDYIVEHVEYDISTSLNSPYYALLQGSSACQGYATLMYKMMTEAGIPCRVITGTAKGGLHAWNIVKLKGEWYNIDATWDDPVGAFGKTKLRYDYFLKSDADFMNHKRDKEFTNTEFYSKYPMAMKSYSKHA